MFIAVFYRHYLKLWYSIMGQGKSSLTVHPLGKGYWVHSHAGGGGCWFPF